MKRKECEIKNKLGLHARPASLVVKLAGKYTSEIELIKEDTEVNAVMMLAAGPGQRVTITAEGPDEVEAVDALAALIDSGFGEELA